MFRGVFGYLSPPAAGGREEKMNRFVKRSMEKTERRPS